MGLRTVVGWLHGIFHPRGLRRHRRSRPSWSSALTTSRPASALLLLVGLTLAGCDRIGEIVIVPEFDLTYSFEGGLEGWVPAGVDLSGPTVMWSIETSADFVSTGSQAIRFVLDNTNGKGKIWIEREFEVEAERAYDVRITFDLASADSGDPWRILAGAHGAPPVTAAELTVQDATATADQHEWTERSYTVRATSDEDGAVYVVLGFWGTSAENRTYYLDNVRLVFTRSN